MSSRRRHAVQNCAPSSQALSFVKDFAVTRNGATCAFHRWPERDRPGKNAAVRFKDGELLCGYSLSYSADRDGFFMFPSDAGSNNLRVYVVASSTVEVKAGPGAEAMAQKALGDRAA
jgi:hypothetical protein